MLVWVLGFQGAECLGCLVFRVLSVQAAAVFRGFTVLGVQSAVYVQGVHGAGCSRCWVIRVQDVQGAQDI